MKRLREDALVRLAGLLAPCFMWIFSIFFFFHKRLGRVVNSNSNQAKLSPPLPAWGQVELTPRDVPSPSFQGTQRETPMWVWETCTLQML